MELSRFSIFVKELWRSVTVKQTKRELVENIQKVKCQIDMVSSETFSLDEIAEELPKTDDIDQRAHQKFLDEFSANENVQTMVRQIFVYYATEIYDLMTPYLAIVDPDTVSLDLDEEDSDDSEIIEPANIGVERCFGVLKFYEDRFKSLTFDALSQLTIAKCNRLPEELSEITDDELIAANRMARPNQQEARKTVSDQRDFIRLNNQRKLSKVISVIFFRC